MNILRVLIIWLIPLSVFAEIPLEYKKIINKYKASQDSFTFVVKNLTNKSEPIVAHNEKNYLILLHSSK